MYSDDQSVIQCYVLDSKGHNMILFRKKLLRHCADFKGTVTTHERSGNFTEKGLRNRCRQEETLSYIRTSTYDQMALTRGGPSRKTRTSKFKLLLQFYQAITVLSISKS